jgi:hypothetical protein
MHRTKGRICAAILAIAFATTPVLAHGPIAAKPAEQEQAKLDADRASILAMAGTYKVKFDFQEQTAWQPDYTPIAPKVSGGHEVVRVIEDTGRRIVLQHILVAENEGKVFPIKHWRQDWEYEPATFLAYAGPNQWKVETVPERMRKGRWSQTVWQTDDSPRYGGFGEWEVQGGIPRWRSGWTWRPLARRDAVRKPVYDRYYAINRHSPAPGGWIHWQDNMKMGMKDGKLVPFVQEMTLNTYTKFDGFDAGRADSYWAKTKDYWAAVRAEWDAVIAKNGGITVVEEAQNGSVTGPKLMGLADEIEAGKISLEAAIIDARAAIANASERPTAAAVITVSTAE